MRRPEGQRSPAAPDMATRREREAGIVLMDALVALVIAAAVLAGIYSLISASARSSANARDTAFAAVAAHSLCVELAASGDLRAGRIVRTAGRLQAVGMVDAETRPGLPPTVRLWRLSCTAARAGADTAAQPGAVLASELTYAVKAAAVVR